jgi:hypothetical protein
MRVFAMFVHTHLICCIYVLVLYHVCVNMVSLCLYELLVYVYSTEVL